LAFTAFSKAVFSASLETVPLKVTTPSFTVALTVGLLVIAVSTFACRSASETLDLHEITLVVNDPAIRSIIMDFFKFIILKITSFLKFNMCIITNNTLFSFLLTHTYDQHIYQITLIIVFLMLFISKKSFFFFAFSRLPIGKNR